MMEGILKEEYLKMAKRACFIAGEQLVGNYEKTRKAESEIGRDIKVKGDKYSESVIIDYLQKHSPFPMLSEEKGRIGDVSSDGYMWIVDPLDGSLNFSRGIPFNCISIALWQNNRPVLGVINDFNRQEMFSGIADEGAWLNDKRIKPSVVDICDQAVLCTGFPVGTDFSTQGIKEFVEDIKRYKKIRLLGSAALSLAYVAAGRSDVYYERDIMLWDVAAGIAIVSGAGGKTDFKRTKREKSFHVYASNGLISR